MKRTHLALILLILCLIGIAACGTAAAAEGSKIYVEDFHEIDIMVTNDAKEPIDEDGVLTSISGNPQKKARVDTIVLTWNIRSSSTALQDQVVIIAYNSEIGYTRTFYDNINCRVVSYNISSSGNPDEKPIIFTGTSDQIAVIIKGGNANGDIFMDMSQTTIVLENLTLTSNVRSPISVENKADITLELRGTSTLRGGTGSKEIAFMNDILDPEYTKPVYDRAGKAGLNVGTDSSITIKSKVGEKGTLIAYGGDGLHGIDDDWPGKSEGSGAGGAGIGTDGAHYWGTYTAEDEYVIPTSGNITIENSIIYAIGGAGGRGPQASWSGGPGAGIGGGGSTGFAGSTAAKAGNITIKDNNEIYVTAGKFAFGETTGPAIGGGSTNNNTEDSHCGEYGTGCSLKIEGENTNIITFSNGFGRFNSLYNFPTTSITLIDGNILQFGGGSQFVKGPNGEHFFPITYIVKDQNGNEIPGVKVTLPAGVNNFTSTYTRPAMTDEKIAEIERIMELTGARSLDRDKTYLFGAGSATVWGEDETGGITFTAPGYVDYTDTVNKIDQKYYTGYVGYSKWEPQLSYGQVIEITMTPLMVQYESESGSEDGNSFIGGTHTVLDIAEAGVFAPAGKVFDKWLGDDGSEYMPGDLIPSLTAVLTLTAHWIEPPYTVQYQSDSGLIDGISDPTGSTYTVLSAAEAGVTAPAGKVFSLWSGSDGSTYAPGQTITSMTTSLVLTAQWITPLYNVQYESASTSADGILDPAGTTYVVLDVAASGISVPGGVAFDSWLGSDGVSYDSGDTIPMTTDLTLTAQWVTASYTVRYESDAGELDGKSYPAGATHTARGTSEADVMGPTGKVFDKWLGSDGNTYVPSSKITVTSDLVLTAQWKTLGSVPTGSGSSSGGTGSAKIVGGTASPVTPAQPDQQSGSQNNNQNNNQNNAPQTVIQQMDFDESKLIRTIAIVGLISGLVGSVIGGALISVVGKKK